MAPSRLMRAPMNKAGLRQKEEEIAQCHRDIKTTLEVDEPDSKKKVANAEKHLAKLRSGEKQGNIANAVKRLDKAKESLMLLQYPVKIQRLRNKIKELQAMIDNNDNVAKQYDEDHAKARAEQIARANALAPPSGLFFKKPANPPKIRRTTVRVRKPLEQQPAPINRPMPTKSTSSKSSLDKATQNAGVTKTANSSAAKKVAEKKALEKVASNTAVYQEESKKAQKAENKSKSVESASSKSLKSARKVDDSEISQSPSEVTSTTSTTPSSCEKPKKRKFTDSASQEDQGPAKKPRSSPEEIEEIQTKSPKKTRSISATARAKKARATSSNAQHQSKAVGDAKEPLAATGDDSFKPEGQKTTEGDVEKSDVEELEAPKTGTASKPKNEQAATDSSASKKRKAEHFDEDDDSHPAKKVQQSSDSDLAKSTDAATSQETTEAATGKKRVVEEGESINIYIHERMRGKWTSKIAGTNWPRGMQKPTQTVDVATPRSSSTGDGDYVFRGLINSKNACFANSAIQLLNTVLTDDQVNSLRGNRDLSMFGFEYKELMLSESRTAKDRGNVEKLRTNISISAAMYGNIEVAAYLGQVLIDLRDGASHKSKKNEGNDFVTPIFFQQVFAYGCSQKDPRLRFDGTTQEDTQEYLMEVIDAVVEEGHTFVRDIFKIEKTSTKKCTACGDESTQEDSDMSILVVPSQNKTGEAQAVKGKPKLADLLDDSRSETDRPEDFKCEKCDALDARENIRSICKLPDIAAGAPEISTEKAEMFEGAGGVWTLSTFGWRKGRMERWKDIGAEDHNKSVE